MTDSSLNLPGMIGRHPSMLEVYKLVRLAAASSLPALVEGATGTGKELVARALHKLGPNPDGPFVDLNCAAIPDGLAEAELFGWERGAFTGALERTNGMLELADGGTLLLDEACSLSLGIQAKLLRAIELKEFRRVGGRCCCTSDFRIVATISEPLETLVETKRMREDFAYRVAGICVRLPSLSARGADVKLLAAHFLKTANNNGHPSKRLDESAQAVLTRHHWPGNVRELKTLMERLDLLCDGEVLTATHLCPELRPAACDPAPEELSELLQTHDWKVAKVARVLGIGRTKVYGLIERHGLERAVPAS